MNKDDRIIVLVIGLSSDFIELEDKILINFDYAKKLAYEFPREEVQA